MCVYTLVCLFSAAPSVKTGLTLQFVWLLLANFPISHTIFNPKKLLFIFTEANVCFTVLCNISLMGRKRLVPFGLHVQFPANNQLPVCSR